MITKAENLWLNGPATGCLVSIRTAHSGPLRDKYCIVFIQQNTTM